ncbi:MAG: hypothetical protein AAF570_06380 [Bacteroidota bacterium]
MKKVILLSLALFVAMVTVQAQDVVIDTKTSEILSIINEHTPPLEEFKEKLTEHKTHLEERIIVLKYHKSNKEVIEASDLVVSTIETYYQGVVERIQQYESVWFDQTRNIMAIYTKYGEMNEASGGGANDLQGFVDQHIRYLDLLENVKSDLLGVYADLSFIKNNI